MGSILSCEEYDSICDSGLEFLATIVCADVLKPIIA